MSLCVNGRWHADACRCFKFWTGQTCDRRLCARGAGVLTPNDGLCRCRPGFGGEFCQYEICRHDQKWYCNTTEMAPPTIWDEEAERIRPPEECSEQVLTEWFQAPQTITPTWYCNCGLGYRGENVTNTNQLLTPSCICPASHFGQFCEADVCSMNKTVWNQENGSCVVPIKVDQFGMGYFGYEINRELTVATLAVFTLIAIFVLVGRWYLKKVDREARAMDECDRIAQRMVHKYKRTWDGVGFGSRHNNKSYFAISTLSPRESLVGGHSARRKEGNVTPMTTPGREYEYKHFYDVGPVYFHGRIRNTSLNERLTRSTKHRTDSEAAV